MNGEGIPARWSRPQEGTSASIGGPQASERLVLGTGRRDPGHRHAAALSQATQSARAHLAGHRARVCSAPRSRLPNPLEAGPRILKVDVRFRQPPNFKDAEVVERVRTYKLPTPFDQRLAATASTRVNHPAPCANHKPLERSRRTRAGPEDAMATSRGSQVSRRGRQRPRHG